MKTIVIVSGGFDPVHKGHIEYFQEAAQLGEVVCCLNSDERLARKKGSPFMDWEERKIILSEMKSISNVISFDDSDGSACDGIKKIVELYGNENTRIVFAKGGDRTLDNIPEVDVCRKLNVEMMFDIGKSGKIQSSSWLIKGIKNT